MPETLPTPDAEENRDELNLETSSAAEVDNLATPTDDVAVDDELRARDEAILEEHDDETSLADSALDPDEDVETDEGIEVDETDLSNDADALSDTVSAAGATKRAKKSRTGASETTKKRTPLDAKSRKDAERKRIERSKQIAAEARSKKGPTARRNRKGGSSGETLTKEQLRASGRTAERDDLNPVWFKPIMFGFLIIGFIWILLYYLSQGRLPIQALGDWNILVGFGIALVGFLMMSNWK